MGGDKVGRNEPCPCGSGKKYKKCCWSKDEAAKAQGVGTQPQSWVGGLFDMVSASPSDRTIDEMTDLAGRTFEVLEDKSGKRLRATLSVFGNMLDTNGPLARIRFDRPLFEKVVAAETKALEDEDLGKDFQDRLFARSIPQLVTRGFLQEARDRLTKYMRRTDAGDEERLATSVALAILSTGDMREPLEASDSPALQMIFDSQLEDGLKPFDGVREKLRSIIERAKAKNLGVSDLEAELHDMGPELAALGQKAPWIFQGMRKESDEVIDKAFKIVGSRKPPPLFTLDEILLLADVFLKLMPRLEAAREARDDAAGKKVVEELIALVDPLIEEFLPGMKARMTRKLDDDRLSRRQREQLGTVMVGFNLDPLRLGFHAFKHSRFQPWLRHDDEEQFVQPLVGSILNRDGFDEALVRYAVYLDEKNEPQAAGRVRRLLGSRQSVKDESPAMVTMAAAPRAATPPRIKR